MFLRLFILFTLVPFLEIALLLKAGQVIGVLPTLTIIIITGVAGAGLARAQGLAVLNRIRSELQIGQLPTDAMIDGVMILSAGLVLLTPGFLTDLVGFFLLLPAGRRLIHAKLMDYFQNKIRVQQTTFRVD